jgi:hypothetical protein
MPACSACYLLGLFVAKLDRCCPDPPKRDSVQQRAPMRGPAVIYVGNLPEKIREQDLQDAFEKVCIEEALHEDRPLLTGYKWLEPVVLCSMDASVLSISRCLQDHHPLRSSSSKSPGGSWRGQCFWLQRWGDG